MLPLLALAFGAPVIIPRLALAEPDSFPPRQDFKRTVPRCGVHHGALTSGTGLLRGWQASMWLYLVGIDMLLYIVIVSPGYFEQKRQWSFLWMFALIIILTLASLVLFIKYSFSS
jgi:hypothetical protein